MSNVVFRVVGEGDLSRLEGELARVEKRLESLENRGRRAQLATTAAAQAGQIPMAAWQEVRATGPMATRTRTWLESLRPDGPLNAHDFDGERREARAREMEARAAESRQLFETLRRQGDLDAERQQRRFWRELRGEHQPLPSVGLGTGQRTMPPWFQRLSQVGTPQDAARAQAGFNLATIAASTQIGQLAQRLAGLTSTAMLTVGGVAVLSDSVSRHANKAYDARIKFDRMERSVEVSTGVSRGLGGAVTPQILRLADEFAMPTDFVATLLDSAVRTSMSKEEAFGPGGRSLLRTAAAMNVTGGPGKEGIQPEQLARTLSGMLTAQDLPFTAANIDRTGQLLRTTYQGQMELGDLPHLVDVLKGLLNKGIGIEQSLANFAAMIDMSISPDVAGTSLRNVTGRLQGIRSSDAKVQALAQLGLTPEQVDLVGEDLSTALGRLKTGADRLGRPRATIALTKIFEELGVAQAETMMSPGVLERVRKYETAMRNPEALDKYVELNQQGAAAAEVRRGVAEEGALVALEKDAAYWEKLKIGDQLMLEKGMGPISRKINSWMAWGLGGLAYNFFGPEVGSRVAAGSIMEDGDRLVEERFRRDRGESALPARGKDRVIELLDGIYGELKGVNKNTAKPLPPPRPMPKPGTSEPDPT